MRNIPTIVAACAALQFTPLVHAGPTALRSPETAETYADNTIQWHQLRWLPGSGQLVATITFCNTDYVSDGEPRHDETFNFPLPGVKFDAATSTFYIHRAHGQSIPVAVLGRKLFVQSIELLPNAQIKVTHRGGLVVVDLVTGYGVLEGERWVENHRSTIPTMVRVAGSPLGSS